MTASGDGPDLERLVERALAREAHAVALLVSVFQDRRRTGPEQRAAVLSLLDAAGAAADAVVIGITGTPGSGKSSLVGRVTREMLRADDALSIGVLAIDPSSAVSGGALLGDRTRMGTDADPRLYFRSEASDAELGGLSPSSFHVCRLLARLFDCVLVETVGIGQSEADVRRLADHVYLVLAPLGGDEVQFMKAGIIEIPDAFVVNKCDEPSADRSVRQLRSSLWLARPFDADDLPVLRTSAKTGEGLEDLCAAFLRHVEAGPTTDLAERDAHFFERWVKDQWGRAGVTFLRDELGGAAGFLRDGGGFDAGQSAFVDRFRAELGAPAR